MMSFHSQFLMDIGYESDTHVVIKLLLVTGLLRLITVNVHYVFIQEC